MRTEVLAIKQTLQIQRQSNRVNLTLVGGQQFNDLTVTGYGDGIIEVVTDKGHNLIIIVHNILYMETLDAA